MNDTLLSEWLDSVLATLHKRREVMGDNLKGAARELTWYMDAVKAARQRIIILENESAVELQPRDTIALQLLTSGSALGDDPATAMAEAFQLADLFLEARKRPTTPTFVPDSPL